jgi:tetratricopeptide (TPR) repeat protein
MRVHRAVLHYCRVCLVLLAVLTVSMVPMRALAACKLGKLELPVTMSDSKPIITAKINGEDARFIADSGAFFSMLTEASAAEFKLKLTPAPYGFYVKGVGGRVNPSIATVKVFTLAGIPVPNVEFLVGGSTVGGPENVGLLGQNFFRAGDVEYDLAKGIIRLIRAKDCDHAFLAYWVKPSEPLSIMDIEWATAASPHTTGTAMINGAKIQVMFDTGAATSILSLGAARRAGVKPDSEGVVYAGYDSGIGGSTVKTYLGKFSSFKIGDEEIRNTRLRFGNISLENADMLLGADFFLSHRIYVASSQRKLYFTYNGGPVFNLTSTSGRPEDSKEGDELADAAAYSQRGTAFAARHDYNRALADLTRASDLAPDKPEYFYQRGVVYQESNQSDLAMADFTRALELKPDDVPSLVARAALRMRAQDRVGAEADLGAADRGAPKEADVRLLLAQGYEQLDRLPQAVSQYDLWIASHRDDWRMSGALNRRCFARALQGEDLSLALADCNAALKLAAKSSPLSASILESRGLVRLRLGDHDKAIADFDGSLKIGKNAWSLYGRGVAEIRKKRVTEGEADIAAARALWTAVDEEFKRHGLSP